MLTLMLDTSRATYAQWVQPPSDSLMDLSFSRFTRVRDLEGLGNKDLMPRNWQNSENMDSGILPTGHLTDEYLARILFLKIYLVLVLFRYRISQLHAV
jgi:hypothetical protein